MTKSSELILHVGMMRTGTTALQRFLWRSIEEGADTEYTYPRTGIYKVSHQVLARSLRQNDQEALGRFRRSLREEVDPAKPTIISCEGFQNFGPAEVERLRDFMDDLFGEVTVVCYFREYLDQLISSFQYNLSVDTCEKTFGEYVAAREAGAGRFLESVLTKWPAHWSRCFRVYDRSRFPEGSIVYDFLGAFGMAVPDVRHDDVIFTLGGNGMYFKMAGDFEGVPFVPFGPMVRFLTRHRLRARPWHIPADRAGLIRSNASYNEILAAHGLAVPLRDYSGEARVPALATLEEDVALWSEIWPALPVETVLRRSEEAAAWF